MKFKVDADDSNGGFSVYHFEIEFKFILFLKKEYTKVDRVKILASGLLLFIVLQRRYLVYTSSIKKLSFATIIVMNIN